MKCLRYREEISSLTYNVLDDGQLGPPTSGPEESLARLRKIQPRDSDSLTSPANGHTKHDIQGKGEQKGMSHSS